VRNLQAEVKRIKKSNKRLKSAFCKMAKAITQAMKEVSEEEESE
jgi:hypothetical protein